jgi:hypothetical protein
MPVNVLNLPGLRVLDFKETDTDYHVKTEPSIVSKLCPHCGRSKETIAHAQKTLFIRDLPSHGKRVAAHLDVPRLRCKPCNKTFTAAVPEVDTATSYEVEYNRTGLNKYATLPIARLASRPATLLLLAGNAMPRKAYTARLAGQLPSRTRDSVQLRFLG